MPKFDFNPLMVEAIIPETKEAYSLRFRPTEPPITYLAGQYLTLRVHIDGEEHRRAYSLSSAPGLDDALQISIKRDPQGLVSNYLGDNLKAGDFVESLAPAGNFAISPKAQRPRHYFLIGAGSGITPLFSMLRTVLHHEPESEISLWYGNRNRGSIMFREALAHLSQRHPARLHVLHSLSQPESDWKGYRGRLTQERIYDLVSEVFMRSELPKVYYLCGPSGLMEAAEAALDKHAVNFNDVHRERFHVPLETLTQDTAAPAPVPLPKRPEINSQRILITLRGESTELNVDPEETILDAAIQADLDPPYACQGGICTSCLAKLTRGKVYMDRTDALSQQEIDEGYILT
ncbi:MAG: ferredoxin--NADP reductase [Bacteroidota bacterium]